MEHKIRDCSLAILKIKPPVKETNSQLVEGAKKDEWTTVVLKGKKYVASAQNPPIGSGFQPMTEPPMQISSAQVVSMLFALVVNLGQ